jgi:hypothetical protein
VYNLVPGTNPASNHSFSPLWYLAHKVAFSSGCPYNLGGEAGRIRPWVRLRVGVRVRGRVKVRVRVVHLTRMRRVWCSRRVSVREKVGGGGVGGAVDVSNT